MDVGQNIEECTLSDIVQFLLLSLVLPFALQQDLLNMDFPFNYQNMTEGIGLLGELDNFTSLDEAVYMSLEPNFCANFGLFDEKQHNFHVLQQSYNTIQCQPNYQTKEELNDCLYANSLEPSQTWTTLSLPQVQFDTQFTHSCTQEPHPKPAEFMDIREMKKELPDQIAFNNTSEKPQRRKPGRKKGQLSNVYHLWEFIRDLLKDPHHKNLITWEDRDKGIFRMIKSGEVAKLWGQKKKNKRLMNYEKMSRSLRYSRKEGYFMEIPRDGSYPKKLCFRFGPKSHGWK